MVVVLFKYQGIGAKARCRLILSTHPNFSDIPTSLCWPDVHTRLTRIRRLCSAHYWATYVLFAYSDKPKEVTQLLCKLPKGRWTVSEIRVVPTQKQDVVTFHVQNPTNR